MQFEILVPHMSIVQPALCNKVCKAIRNIKPSVDSDKSVILSRNNDNSRLLLTETGWFITRLKPTHEMFVCRRNMPHTIRIPHINFIVRNIVNIPTNGWMKRCQLKSAIKCFGNWWKSINLKIFSLMNCTSAYQIFRRIIILNPIHS